MLLDSEWCIQYKLTVMLKRRNDNEFESWALSTQYWIEQLQKLLSSEKEEWKVFCCKYFFWNSNNSIRMAIFPGFGRQK